MTWAIDWAKGDFVGKDALLKQRLEGTAQTLVAFHMIDRGVPRHEYSILSEGRVVGEVTSGMYAPTLDEFLGMGYVPTALRRPGTEIAISIRGREHRAVIVKKPFYVPSYRRR
ncbi:MAG: glycine cleavage T C-terminal barrel domain-containing protein [Anaerolineales bacterium]